MTQSQQPSFEIKAPPDLEKVRSSVSITHSDVTVPDLVPNSPKRFLDLIDDTRPSKNLAAKAGVIQLTRTMAIELAPHGILVNCVAPGSTLTEGTRALFYGEDATMRDRRERMLSHVPLARPGTTEEIASAVLFFAAPDASYITGQTLCVDGGWTAGGFFRDF